MRADTEWFRACGWGVFAHYLTAADTPAQVWNEQVDRFDVEGLAEQLAGIGAPYYFITIGQNSGHYCAPNATYDRLVGIEPSKCSRRDLIADLYAALNPRGIALLVYLPSGAPAADPVAVERLEWKWGFKGVWPAWETGRTGERLASFQRKWEAVVAEWSRRWGRKVRGWWIDGCYFADEMYRHLDEPNFASFAAALKAGNPDSLVAFNPGVKVPVICHTEFEDYTAGEIADAFPVCPAARVDGAQYHVLTFLGERWGGGNPRFPDEWVIGYTRHVNARGGVVTWDVPIEKEGLIPAPFVAQLTKLSRSLAG